MINSKKKGAAGEREFANYCKEKGFDVRRTAQYNGKEEFSLKDPQTEGLGEYTITYSLIDLKKQLEALNQDEVEIQFDNESEIIKFDDGKIIEIVGPIDPEGAQ